ncbi:MAG: hypothetical protein WCO54_08090 [Bacteroidota bacterium]
MKVKHYLFFAAIILGLSILFEYHLIIDTAPQSCHIWRQSDCVSFATNYYENGMHFNEPRVYNELTSNGYCVGEFPIIYFTVAEIWNFTGQHFWVFRSLQLLIFFGGLFSLFSMTFRLTANIFLAYFLPILLFSSPFVMLYANSFLPDVPSLSFVLIGLNLLTKYKAERKIFLLFPIAICLMLAVLLKANAMIAVAAFFIMLLLENIGIKFNEEKKYFQKFIPVSIVFVSVFVAAFIWYRWAINYNKKFDVTFLGTGAWPGWPLWEATPENIKGTLSALKNYVPEFWSLSTWIGILLCFVLVVKDFFKMRFFSWLSLGILAGSALLYVDFFVGFRDNNYYFINLMILPLTILLATFIHYPDFFTKKTVQAFLIVLLVVNIFHAKSMLRIYYHGGWKHDRFNEAFYEKDFRNFIDQNIEKDAKVASIPDVTPNGTLLLLQRHGVSNYGFHDWKVNEKQLSQMIDWGYKYMVVSGNEMLQDSTVIKYCKIPKAQFNDIRIFELKKILN